MLAAARTIQQPVEAVVPPLPLPLAADLRDASITIQEVWHTFVRRRQRHNKRNKKQDNYVPTLLQRHAWSCFTNMVLLAPTGSGKTLAYGLPLVVAAAVSGSNNSSDTINQRPLQNTLGLVLAPTRELVQQVVRELRKVLVATSAVSHSVICALHGGDTSRTEQEQLAALRTARVVVATPGRLLDVAQRNPDLQHIWWSRVRRVVLDEADRLAGSTDLRDQVDALLALVARSATASAATPSDMMLCLCSATQPESITVVWDAWLRTTVTPKTTSKPWLMIRTVGNANQSEKPKANGSDVSEHDESAAAASDWSASIPSNIRQTIHVCAQHKKPRKLLHTLQRIRHQQDGRQAVLGLVFCNHIKTVNYLQTFLRKEHVNCVALHSHMPQVAREQALSSFGSGKCPLLLATDVAARGLHLPHIAFIIQYDMASNLATYVHRCGRAGRAGQAATVFAFMTRNLIKLAPALVRLLESHQQWVDPNLRALMNDHGSNGTVSQGERPLEIHSPPTVGSDESEGNDVSEYAGDGSDKEEFVNLAPAIALHRADHVSDATSVSSAEGDDE